MPNGLEKLKAERQAIAAAVRQRTLGYVVAAFGLVVGLAWNDAMRALIQYLFPLEENTILAQFVYAAVLTLILVVVTTYLTRFLGEKAESERRS